MRARLVVFPVKGRNWCFSRSIESTFSAAGDSKKAADTLSELKQLWKKISSNSDPKQSNAELVIDFASAKMNRAWTGLEEAPKGSFKSKLHGVGLTLLARVKPSEMFLKSITKDVSSVEITYPPSLNPRLVRRRLRHIAQRGNVIHEKYFYGSLCLVPVTALLAVLPLPNIPFFWILFRTYSHWRAQQGSNKLLRLVSDGSDNAKEGKKHDNPKEKASGQCDSSTWKLKPSKELEALIKEHEGGEGGLSDSTILSICNKFNLNANEVLKYKKSM